MVHFHHLDLVDESDNDDPLQLLLDPPSHPLQLEHPKPGTVQYINIQYSTVQYSLPGLVQVKVQHGRAVGQVLVLPTLIPPAMMIMMIMKMMKGNLTW